MEAMGLYSVIVVGGIINVAWRLWCVAVRERASLLGVFSFLGITMKRHCLSNNAIMATLGIWLHDQCAHVGCPSHMCDKDEQVPPKSLTECH
jgi:hypothetical protein